MTHFQELIDVTDSLYNVCVSELVRNAPLNRMQCRSRLLFGHNTCRNSMN